MKKNIKPWTNKKKKRKHGFRKRMKSKDGRLTIKARRKKGRKKLTP